MSRWDPRDLVYRRKSVRTESDNNQTAMDGIAGSSARGISTWHGERGSPNLQVEIGFANEDNDKAASWKNKTR